MYDFLLIFSKNLILEVYQDIEQRVDEAGRGYKLSLENVLQQGFNHFRRAPGPYILYGILAALVFSNPLSGLLLGGPLSCGFYTYTRRVQQKGEAEFGDFFLSFDHFLPLLILQLLISVLVTLGFLLLVIPGIYFAISYFFAQFFVLFHGKSPTEAIGLSRRMVGGNFLQILILCLVLLGINILGTMAFGVGLLLSIPLSACMVYAAFDDIIDKIFDEPTNLFIASQFNIVGTPHYKLNTNFMGGLKFGEWDGKGLVLYLSYYLGSNPFSEYYTKRVKQFGVGFFVDFF
jgi:hypothetical protein